MKRLLLSFAYLALSTGTFAQAPQGINYQAVIRYGVGVTLNNTNVGMKISIIQTSPGGTVVYEESFATTTSQYGLVNDGTSKFTLASSLTPFQSSFSKNCCSTDRLGGDGDEENGLAELY